MDVPHCVMRWQVCHMYHISDLLCAALDKAGVSDWTIMTINSLH